MNTRPKHAIQFWKKGELASENQIWTYIVSEFFAFPSRRETLSLWQAARVSSLSLWNLVYLYRYHHDGLRRALNGSSLFHIPLWQLVNGKLFVALRYLVHCDGLWTGCSLWLSVTSFIVTTCEHEALCWFSLHLLLWRLVNGKLSMALRYIFRCGRFVNEKTQKHDNLTKDTPKHLDMK